MSRILALGLIAFSLFLLSCSVNQQPYDIDKVSPDGKYRVKIRVTPAKPPESLDQAKFEFFKGDKIVDTWDWRQEDHYEAGADSLLPIEWVSNNVLLMGAERPKEGLADELTIVNAMDENLEFVGISYGRYQSFKVFDLAPGMRIKIQANHQSGGKDYNLSYGGMTQSGKRFGSVDSATVRESGADGRANILITISGKDLYQ
jgi:hypothetical protein